MSSRDERRKEEKKIAKDGGDTPYPGYEALKAEELEQEPAILITVTDADGNIVRRLSGPKKTGVHRVAWDLRYPSTRAGAGDFFSRGGSGFLAAPGTYTVTLSKRVNGETTQLGESQTVEVVPLYDGGTLAGATPQQVADFMQEVAELVRVSSAVGEIVEETEERVEAIAKALANSRTVDLDGEVHALKVRLYEMRDRLEGDQQMQEFSEPEPASISKRMMTIFMGNSSSTYGPTPTHLRSFEIAQQELAAVKADLEQLVEVDLPALEEKLEAAGVPWTPGRSIP
jgi:hypothetical protein